MPHNTTTTRHHAVCTVKAAPHDVGLRAYMSCGLMLTGMFALLAVQAQPFLGLVQLMSALR